MSQDPRQNTIKWLLILVKILWDLRQDFERLKSILFFLLLYLNQLWERSYSIIDRIISNPQYPRESYKILQDPKQNSMEFSTSLDKMLEHLRQDERNNVTKYTSAYSSWLMKREGSRNILCNPY